MAEVTVQQIQALFLDWVASQGLTKVTSDQINVFMDTYVLNDPNTVIIDGATVSALWSGSIGDASAEYLADEIAAQYGVRIVRKTGAGGFYDWFLGSDWADPTAKLKANTYRNWDKISALFVEYTDHPLITITPLSGANSVYGRIEVDAVANNDDIEIINGVARKDIGIDIFSSGTDARRAYLMAVLNGDFAGSLLHGTANTIKTDDLTDLEFLSMDAETLARFSILGAATPPGEELIDNEELRNILVVSYVRGLQAALFGPVMHQNEQKFVELVGLDYGTYDDAPSPKPDGDFATMQADVVNFIQKIWDQNPTADIWSLLQIIKQVRIEDIGLVAFAEYFGLVAKHVSPYIDDAPEQLKRDLEASTNAITQALANAFIGVPAELQERLAVTSGGRLIYLLDEQRQATLDPLKNLTGIFQGVGTVSRSDTDLGHALYITLGKSTIYALLRNIVETVANTATDVPMKAIAEAFKSNYPAIADGILKAMRSLDRLVDHGLDALGNPFRNAVFAHFSYADGKAATQAFDSTDPLGNLLQLQFGRQEATLIGNDNMNVAVHTGHGDVFGMGGKDILVGLLPDTDGWKSLRLDGGDGNDLIVTVLGHDAQTVGGMGRDFIFNTSYHGEIYGDTIDGLIPGTLQAVPDTAANADNIWYWPGTSVMDAQTHDQLQFFGIPLTGGDAQMTGVALRLGLRSGSLMVAGGVLDAFSAAAFGVQALLGGSIYFDNLLPFMAYVRKGNDLEITNVVDLLFGFVTQGSNLLDTDLDDESDEIIGHMAIKNFHFVSSPWGIVNYAQSLNIPGFDRGTMNMVFKDPNPLYAALAILNILPPMLASEALVLELQMLALEDAIYGVEGAFKRRAESIGWWEKTDPLIIDLDGDGIETVASDRVNVYFDVDDDLFAERTGWVKGDDGFLVLDSNHNGRVDNITEMFGNRHEGGYAELAGYDSNADGKITLADAIWSELRIWQDLDQDGETDAGELKSLDQLGIVSISLASQAIGLTTPQGAELVSGSDVTFASGRISHMFEALFQSDDIDTHYAGEDGRAAWQPSTQLNSKGFGSITDLGVALANDLELGDIAAQRAAAMDVADIKQLVALAGDVLGAWGMTQDLTRELTPVLLGTDANGKAILVDRAVYIEDSTGGYWTLASGNPIKDPLTGQAIARASFEDVVRQVVTSGQHWQVEQAWSPASRGTALQFRDDTPYLVHVVDGRAIVDDWGVKNSDGSWRLFSGAQITDSNGQPIAFATVDDILRMQHLEGQEWRVENIGFNPIADLPVESIGVRFTDGIAVDYTVKVTDQDGTFYIWARNLDRALELEAKTGDYRGFNLRNYEIDFDHLDEVGSTDDSTYRVELLTPAQFNFALQLGGMDFHPEMLTAIADSATGHLAYSMIAGGSASLSATSYVSAIDEMIGMLQPAMQEYIIASRRFAVRLALQGGLSEFAQGIRYDPTSDKYRPVGGRELAPMFEAIFAGAPESNDNDAVFDYLTNWNALLWQIYPD